MSEDRRAPERPPKERRSAGSAMAARVLRAVRGSERDVDPRIPDAVLVAMGFEKLLDAVRGVLLGLRGARVAVPCFVGRHVGVSAPRQLCIGRGSEIREHARIEALSTDGVRIGANVTIDRNVIIRCTGTLRELGQGVRIGDGSAIGAFSYLGGSGGLVIGRDVLGGQSLSFHPEDHVHERSDLPMKDQGTTRAGIVIEDDCWLGTGSIYLDGIRVGTGSVVAAGSVVTEDVPPMSVVAGVPARILRSRA